MLRKTCNLHFTTPTGSYGNQPQSGDDPGGGRVGDNPDQGVY